jgi:hypothetical protein
MTNDSPAEFRYIRGGEELTPDHDTHLRTDHIPRPPIWPSDRWDTPEKTLSFMKVNAFSSL